ncbi:MAG TPA: hypothetical protein VMW10_02330, partial [Alphaproteobacteria bacterium]|nr:hypothetical protein [Alphaproteobacteria bacterium]
MRKYALLAGVCHILFFSTELEAGRFGRVGLFSPFIEGGASFTRVKVRHSSAFNHRFFSSSKSDKELASFAQDLRDSVKKDLNHSGKASIKACFLGPRAENLELLESLVSEAIKDHAYWRRNFYPKDPAHITEELKRSQPYLETVDTLRKHLRYLLVDLKRSLPTSSPRYQGHMNWEVTLPSLAGYFAAMLYNQNGVSFEGSPATTMLEVQVGEDLCQMIGYNVPTNKDDNKAKIPSWGHLTCDGSVANIEALWSARNLKFYPLAVKWALESDDLFKDARELTVKLPTGEEKQLLSLDEWSLLNIESDQALELPVRIYALLNKPDSMPLDVLYNRLAKFSIQKRGLK